MKLVRIGPKPADDYVAAIGDNRKLLVVFPLDELPEMSARTGRPTPAIPGRRACRRDHAPYSINGLSWAMGGETKRTRTEADLGPWRTARGAAGRMPPTGFPRDNRFG